MNTKDIQPINIWSPSGQRVVNKISLDNFYGYKFDDGIGYVDYALIGSQGEVYYNGNVEIPSSIIQQWGASDNIIWDYIANTLSLTIINNQ